LYEVEQKQKHANLVWRRAGGLLVSAAALAFVARMALIVIISLTNATDSVFVKAVLRVDNESESGQFPDLRFTKSPAESRGTSFG